MTTIAISTSAERCSLVALGHADYAESGKDIVCAGITAIVYSLANYLVNAGEAEEVDMAPGNVRICGKERRAFEQAFYGLKAIEQKYPKNLRVFYER